MNAELTASVVFWLAAGTMIYVYAGYPLLIRALARLLGRPVAKSDLLPRVTVIVTAFNEERGIRAKLDNLASQDYPRELMDILVASDGSTDTTDAIVRSYPDARVRLLRVEGRMGKTACQNQAVTHSRGDIVVFTDATTEIEPHSLRRMARNFADPKVGAVAATLVYVGKGKNLTAVGGTAYWNYETALRVAESALGSLIGVSGCLYGVRRAAYRPIGPHLISDFVIAMRMREQDLRTVLEPEAVCFEETLDRSQQELSMRVRVSIRSIAAIVEERAVLESVPLRLVHVPALVAQGVAVRLAVHLDDCTDRQPGTGGQAVLRVLPGRAARGARRRRAGFRHAWRARRARQALLLPAHEYRVAARRGAIPAGRTRPDLDAGQVLTWPPSA